LPVFGCVVAVQVDVRWTLIGSVVGKAAENTGDVLPHQPSGPCAIKKLEKFEGQVATVVSHSASKAGDREALAGGSSDKKVNWAIFVASDRSEVAVTRCVWVMMLEHGAGERLDFAERSGFPAKRMPSDGCGLDAGADAQVSHRS
jgi:hypothetical protein